MPGCSRRLTCGGNFGDCPAVCDSTDLMTCGKHCQESADLFDRKRAEKELRKYRKGGPPNKSTRLLIDAFKSLEIDGKTLLDIGGGVATFISEFGAGSLARTSIRTSTRLSGNADSIVSIR